MKATGMIRRIDDLGRIVIPKEIRKTLKLKVGDEIEIYTEDNGLLVMKKHSRIVGFGNVGQGVVEAIYRSLGGTILLSDSTHVLYTSGAYRKNYDKEELTSAFVNIVEKRRGSILAGENIVNIVKNDSREYNSCYVSPIIVGGDLYGSLTIMLSEGDIHEVVSVIDTAVSFLALNID